MAAARPAKASSPASRPPSKGAPRRQARGNGGVAPAAAQAVAKADNGSSAEGAETKTAKPKLVRDSFTIPKSEYAVLAELKQRSARLGHPAKKSEVLRAGIAALRSMPDASLLKALQAIPSLKTGRPKSSSKR